MKKLMILSIAAVLALCTAGCEKNKTAGNDSSEVTETTKAADQVEATTGNPIKKYLGKWEAVKASASGQVMEDNYYGYPFNAVAMLEIFDDHTAEFRSALNSHGKETVREYAWELENGELILEDNMGRLRCYLRQGQLVMTAGDQEGASEIFLLSVNEFSSQHEPPPEHLSSLSFEEFQGKWESFEVKADDVVYTDYIGEYNVNSAFRLEIYPDGKAELLLFGSFVSYQWEPESENQLYIWNEGEGFAATLEDDVLLFDNEIDLQVKMHMVDEYSYLNPMEETT